MEAKDLFRLLGAGAKFDFKRFKGDAEKLEIIRPKKEKDQSDGIAATLDFFGDASKQSSITHGEHKDGESDSENDVVLEENMPSQELQLLGNIKSSGLETKSESRKRKKKKSNKKNAKKADLKQEKVNHFRRQHRIHVHGTDIPDPIASFEQLKDMHKVNPKILDNVKAHGYNVPTPIQMQAIPAMLHRRELLACAPTGSGKTAAFVLPVLHHLCEPRNTGIRALILAPTRELAKQTYRECCRLAEGTGLRINFIEKAITAGQHVSQKFDVLVTTPNRLVFLLKHDPPIIKLSSVEWLIVDESDKLFEEGKQGFRDQLACIYNACDNPNVRRGMFSATFADEVEEWCRLNLDNVLSVYIGARNAAADLVQQELVFVGNESGKLLALRDIFKKGFHPPVLIFLQSKERAKELFSELIYDGMNVDVIHADRTQLQRDNVVKSFRAGKIWVLICTELMGRGIDFKGVNLVVNFDFPNSAISYIHRIGRTGRAGRPGRAVTFFTENDAVNLRSIANVMQEAGCPVPEYMMTMKKPDKKVKRKLARSAVKRKPISTVPKYDRERSWKRKEMILHTRKKTQKRVQDQEDGANTVWYADIPEHKKNEMKKREKMKAKISKEMESNINKKTPRINKLEQKATNISLFKKQNIILKKKSKKKTKNK
ncbi:probable ATP-dependent RNA helicase DDX52 isoform X2 [Lingula anatina]|uniref:Probable ATP-dependent RNA helicase DDX52 n=1 Tax=Lingula anatina TaxID=7574 RepID=A0A1S3K2T2_LINAN|nr:probable ATP-dependent RNA helicase DDX52 isoform X1 [Lingula anatina]XP_013416567.1 probable ATP-dependent RNA helicase DDX52 isoform X2 [Lingula anatina]|eukprot:XP_013416566.1 probable ATP-dependent RNA helicase DDX52 isoform X1 [Lingula anatina]